MFLTRECDYGIRIIRALADGNKKNVETIAGEEHIPIKYAYKIVRKLQAEGYLTCLRGRGGGFTLLKPLNTITMADIVVALDNSRLISECLRDDADCPKRDNEEAPCTVHEELKRVQAALVAELSAQTMDKILQVHCQKPI